MKKEPLDWLHSFTNQSLHLILFMTEQCNFRCIYCYEDFKLGNIQNDVILGVKNLISKRIGGLKHLSISYFGGEPLLNKAGVTDMTQWAQKICSEHGVKYDGNITTNGYSLDEKIFKTLLKGGINSYQVTLDGDKASHDKLRPTLNGKSTFDKIYANLLMMSRSNGQFECLVRLNVSDANFDGVRNFITSYLLKDLKEDRRFKVHFHPIWGRSELTLERNKNLSGLYELLHGGGMDTDMDADLADDSQASGLNNKGRDIEYVCYAAKANSFSIRANGVVQKCTVALNDDVNTIGRLHPDGTMTLDEEKLRKWIFASEKGCPLQALALENLAVPYKDAGKFATLAPELQMK